MKKSLILLTILVFALTISTAVLAKSLKFEIIDYPGASGTSARGINNRGQIVGSYYLGKQYGYLLDGDTFTTIEFPEAQSTEVYGINDRGQIVGIYIDNSWVFHGFLSRWKHLIAASRVPFYPRLCHPPACYTSFTHPVPPVNPGAYWFGTGVLLTWFMLINRYLVKVRQTG